MRETLALIFQTAHECAVKTQRYRNQGTISFTVDRAPGLWRWMSFVALLALLAAFDLLFRRFHFLLDLLLRLAS